MKLSLVLLLILSFSCPVKAVMIKKINTAENLDHLIEELYCSTACRVIKFESKHQYKNIHISLMSPRTNGIVKIKHPEQVIVENKEVKLLKGRDKSIRMKILPFNGFIKVEFYSKNTEKLLSELILKGVLCSYTQRTTIQYNTGLKIYHNIQYKDWTFNIGLNHIDERLESNISISKKWR